MKGLVDEIILAVSPETHRRIRLTGEERHDPALRQQDDGEQR